MHSQHRCMDQYQCYCIHTAHQIGALQFQLQKILFGTSQKCRDGQQTLISCTSFQILHLQLAVLFQTKSPMSTFSVSGPKILSHIMPRSADDDTVCENRMQLNGRTNQTKWSIQNYPSEARSNLFRKCLLKSLLKQLLFSYL